jgi:hypothetical protein
MLPQRWRQLLLAALAAWAALVLFGVGSAFATVPSALETRVGASSLVKINTVGSSTDIAAGQRLGKTVQRPQIVVATGVAAEAATDATAVGFRSDATHIFRDAAGHFADDTAANRAIIRGAVDPANLRSTITLKDGATLSKYFQTLPDRTQAWAEVRNGTVITNGGLNVIPR